MSLMLNRCVVRGVSTSARLMGGEPGSGSGKGGGSGGSVRSAGGSLGKLEAAREDEYFHKLQRLQIKSLKDQLAQEVAHHENQADRHKKRLEELKREEETLNKKD